MTDEKKQLEQDTVEPQNNTETTKQTDETPSDTQELAEQQSITDPTESLKEQLQEQKDKYLRLYADFDNYKKRMARERLELIDSAGKDIISSMLTVLDDFERAQKNADTTQDATTYKEGILLIQNKLSTILQQKGLKTFDSLGQPFDVEKHEAITDIPVADEAMKGKVVDEVERGYILGEKILRYAKVVVGK